MSDPLQTGFTRVFLIEGRARADRQPSYESTMKMAGVEQGFGDVTSIYSPHPRKYDSFEIIGTVRGEAERPTTSLIGRYAINLQSQLLRLAKIGCSNDVQLHMGSCTDPSDFNEFKKALIIEDALIPTWSTDDLGALQPDEKSLVNETAEISGAQFYEVLPLNAASKAADVLTNEVIDMVFCDSVSCGDCEDPSDGCLKAFGVTKAAGGSPGTPADVVFSLDKGATWMVYDVDSLGAAEDPNALACIGNYIVVVSNDSGSLHYALKTEFDGLTDPAFTEVTTGFAVGGAPNAIDSVGSKAFIVGDGGYIYSTPDPTGGVDVLDAGAATPVKLNAVDAISEDFAVAVGNDGGVVFTSDGASFAATTTSPVGVGVNLTTVGVVDENYWLVGTSNGRLYYTFNQGKSWTLKGFPGSGTGIVWDIAVATRSVIYLAHSTTAPSGRILRSFDGGYSWNLTPEGTAVLPANDHVAALAVCEFDANLVIGGGLADDATDGFIVVEQD